MTMRDLADRHPRIEGCSCLDDRGNGMIDSVVPLRESDGDFSRQLHSENAAERIVPSFSGEAYLTVLTL